MEGTLVTHTKAYQVLEAFILVFPRRDKIIRRFRVKEPNNVHLKEEHELEPGDIGKRHVEWHDSVLDIEHPLQPAQYLRLQSAPPLDTLDCEALVSLHGRINDTPHERAPEGPPFEAEPRRFMQGTGTRGWRVFDIQWFYDFERRTASWPFPKYYEIT